MIIKTVILTLWELTYLILYNIINYYFQSVVSFLNLLIF